MEVIMTIGLAPVTKKNSQQILKNAGTGRPFIVPSRAYREYAEAAAWCLRTYRLETIRQPVEVKALFFMPTRRRGGSRLCPVRRRGRSVGTAFISEEKTGQRMVSARRRRR